MSNVRSRLRSHLLWSALLLACGVYSSQAAAAPIDDPLIAELYLGVRKGGNS